jgi:aspartyl/asparaginyl beta-hydroxylase (cupin superfamily)
MHGEEQQAQSLIRQGVEALRQGRPAEAAPRFERAAATGAGGELAWVLLAVARRQTGDARGEEAAVNRLIELQPHSVRGHVMKGDCRAEAGDEPFACYFYREAVRLAEGQSLTAEVAADLRRAADTLAGLESRAHAVREAKLKLLGVPEEAWSPRLRHALELAAGRRKVYRQQPTSFYFPELPQRQYYEAAEFGWAAEVEAAAPAIRAELLALLEAGTEDFRPYIQDGVAGIPLPGNKALLGKKDWSVRPLCENGFLEPDMIERCPVTWRTVLQAPVPRVPGWGPTVLFSLLKAGARIAPHTGMFNTRLICHLPLVVPEGCRFRVGNEVRAWEEGRLLIFDDTIEHEAWNESGEDRVVLIFDIWRPELSERERHELTMLFTE